MVLDGDRSNHVQCGEFIIHAQCKGKSGRVVHRLAHPSIHMHTMIEEPYRFMSLSWVAVFAVLVSLQLALPRILVVLFPHWHIVREPTHKGGNGSAYFTYLVLSGGFSCACASFGTAVFFKVYGTIPDEERLRAEIPEAQALAVLMVAYQMYNIVTALSMSELCTLDHLAHHASTAILAWFVTTPLAHYHALFFMGVVELTNFPLTFVDAAKAFPRLRDSMPVTNTACRILFALSFFAIRILAWSVMSLDFWGASVSSLRDGSSQDTVVVLTFLVGNVLLTGIQFYWGCQLIGFVRKSLTPTTSGHDLKSD